VKRLAGIEKSDLTFLPESQSSPLPGSSIRSVCGSFKVPDSPSSGLDTSSFLAPSQPALLPKARPLLGTAGTGTAASSNQPDDSEAAEDISVVEESDEEEEEGPELLEKHSLRSDGDVSKEETALRDSTVMVTPEKPATRHDSRQWTDSALLGAATQAAGDNMTESALLEAETQEVNLPMSESALLGASTQAFANAQLSDSSALLDAPTQAVTHVQLSDSELFWAPTQAVAKDRWAGTVITAF